jgi:hypothetical protein
MFAFCKEINNERSSGTICLKCTYSVKFDINAASGRLTSNVVSLSSYNSFTTVDVTTVSANRCNMSDRIVKETTRGP